MNQLSLFDRIFEEPADNEVKLFRVGNIVKCTTANHQHVWQGQIGSIVQYPVANCWLVAIVEFGNEHHPNRWAVRTEDLAFL
jgi:hypothetical protein